MEKSSFDLVREAMHAEERVAALDSVKHRAPFDRLAQSDHSRNNRDPGNFLDPWSANVSEWWGGTGIEPVAPAV